ncbi:MAG: SWIM zinc finger family protein [Tetrasphaera sp.]
MSSRWFPPPARPRPVADGIRARSRRGAIAQTWWSERFIGVLESLGVGARLQRGKTYARKGQVMDLTIEPGAVTARVQGTRAKPYRVRIGVTPFDKTAWSRVTEALASDAWYIAKLLAGEMPDDIEEVFTAVGLSLFPASSAQLSLDCTCPDWSVPCKHLVAVFYLLAESFDEDPFGILAWRGRDRDDLLETLAALRSGTHPADRQAETEAVVPLADCLGSFYAPQGEMPSGVPVAAPSDALLDQVPPIGVTIRGVDLHELLRAAYLRLGQVE